MRTSGRRIVAAALAIAGITVVAAAGSTAAEDPPARANGLELVGSVDLDGAMSLAFSTRTPHAYVHTRQGGGRLVVLDIEDPVHPEFVSSVPVVSGPYMEDLQIGERAGGVTFALVRTDSKLSIVDVTKPDDPRKRGTMVAESHTYECADVTCAYAYATWASSADNLHFAVLDLRDLDQPRLAATFPSPIGILHDWHRDAAGVMWAVGANGFAAYDVTIPTAPRLLNRSDIHGVKSPLNPYNDRLQFHGAQRPDAAKGGDVLFVSEEGDNADCTDSFQTWRVPSLDAPATLDLRDLGTITPISSWSLLDADPATLPVDPAFCSVHWFDSHEAGLVAIPTYAAGTRVLDVRDPADIRQVGYHFTDDSMAIQSYWVPERKANGRLTGRHTRLIYTTDAGLVANPFLPSPILSGGGVRIFRASDALFDTSD
jgi:hypothetical protein